MRFWILLSLSVILDHEHEYAHIKHCWDEGDLLKRAAPCSIVHYFRVISLLLVTRFLERHFIWRAIMR
jgi:hypothetical protein